MTLNEAPDAAQTTASDEIPRATRASEKPRKGLIIKLQPRRAGDCTCGLPLWPIHCPQCGRRSVYGRKSANRYLELNDAQREEMLLPPEAAALMAYGFHCRLCHLDFDTLTQCEAEQFEFKTMKARRKVEEAAELVAGSIATETGVAATPSQMDKIIQAFKQVGIDPHRKVTSAATPTKFPGERD